MKKQRTLLAAVLVLAAVLMFAAVSVASADTEIDADEAQKIALADAGVDFDKAVWLKVKYDNENGVDVYEVEFTADGVEYEYDITISGGKILKKKTEYYLINAPEGGQANMSEEEVTAFAAKDAGLNVNDISLVDVYLKEDDGRPEYKVKFYAGGYKYEYEIDVLTGKITEKTVEMTEVVSDSSESGSKEIGVEKAKAIALAHAGLDENSVYFKKIKRDTEHGRLVYEIEFDAKGYEYEYEIDAYTGKIVDYEIERD